jgi:tetratricopeptide (TPR) repeat protein
MSQKKLVVGLCALCLLAVAGLWLMLDRKNNPPAPSSTQSPAPPDRVHEKASLTEQLKKNPAHAPILLRLAQLASEEQNPGEARRLLEELLRAEPAHIEARLELGRACYLLNDLACATSETERILAVSPNNVDALYNLGAISANAGQNDKARQYWKRAAESAPSSESGRKAAAGLRQLGG